MRKLCLIIVGLCCVIACRNDSIDKKDHGLAYKETIAINDVPKATLTFFDFADGRCPADVNCIWGGYALVDLLLSGVTVDGRISEHVEMCLGECRFVRKDSTQTGYMLGDTVVKSFAGQQYKFILSDLSPGPRISPPQKKEDRRITLKIEKN